MKLSHLQEAKYAGNHPIIDEMKDIIYNQSGRVFKDWTIPDVSFDDIFKEITKVFGEPDLYKPHFSNAEWLSSTPQREGWISLSNKGTGVSIEAEGDDHDAF